MGLTERTKIIATLGPASNAPATIDALIEAGVDVFRLNFSHGTHEAHHMAYHAVRDAAVRAGRHIAILQDLSGPKIRIGSLRGGQPLHLAEGEELRVATGVEPGGPGRVFTSYEALVSSVRPGDRLLLDDGRIELRVRDRTASELITVIVHGGSLAEHKGINAPGVKLPAGAVTAKDEDDLRFGLKLGVDLVALSFVQTPEDILRARAIAESEGSDVPLIAKIERPEAVRRLGDIVSVADGVMVARGDLGLECSLEQVPRIQKQIIRQARISGRPVIVATQVLESMRSEPRPTRAEVSDAATAVDQGADAIMLAGETAIGDYPVRAVQTLSAVISEAERLPLADLLTPTQEPSESRHSRALCEAAVTLATAGQADAIVAVTREGKTAKWLSCLRPRASILAVTSLETIANRLALYWGVTPLLSAEQDTAALDEVLRSSAVGLSPGAVVVFINVSPDLSRHDANFLNVQRLAR